MRVLITGGRGFVGSKLIKNLPLLLKKRLDFSVLSRKSVAVANAAVITKLDPDQHYDIIINLAGENIASGRWTAIKKQEIVNSRIHITEQLNEYLKVVKQKPQMFFSASAIGYYGVHPQHEFNESDMVKHPQDFPQKLCADWENCALQAKEAKINTHIIRFGIILDKHQGALKKMLPSFQFGLGATIGSGKQWMSWIAIDDVISAMAFCIEHNQNLPEILNFTSPYPVQNKEFTKTLAAVLQRPSFMCMPALAVRMLFGEMGEKLLLQGQKVMPQALQKMGYAFQYPKLEPALRHILQGT